MNFTESIKNIKKIDVHNHLNLGMQYATYKKWAGFEIPDFPRKLNGLDEMHEIIGKYTRPRCKTSQDVVDLVTMSIKDALSDNVEILEGSIDISFIGVFDEDFDKFFNSINDLVEEYRDKIDFRPELGIGKTFDHEKTSRWAPVCIESGVFKSIDLYGPEVTEGIEDFAGLYKLCAKKGLKKKAHVGEFSDAASVKAFAEFFDLDEIQHGIGAAGDDKVLRFLADKNIRCNVTPCSNVMLGAVKSLKEHPIRKMMDAGVRVSLGTDDLLFFNRTVSMQMRDLLDEGVLTEAHIRKILEER